MEFSLFFWSHYLHSGSARTLSCWQLETPDPAPGHRNGPAGAIVFILFWGPWKVKAFQGAGLAAWGSEYMDVANFDYWKELLRKQQLVKEVSPGETGHCFCQDQDPTQTELCFLYSGYSSIQNQGKGLDCITCSGSRWFLNTEPNSGAKCLLRPQGQIYISDLKKTLGKCSVRLNDRKQTKLGQS